MSYKILLHPKAAKFLERLEASTKQRIKEKIKALEKNPGLGKHLKYSSFWSLRIGDYRAIYEVAKESQQIIILFIGHRKSVYDDFSKLL